MGFFREACHWTQHALDVMHTVHQFYLLLPAVSVLSACVKNSAFNTENVFSVGAVPRSQLSQRDCLLYLVECFEEILKGSSDGCHC